MKVQTKWFLSAIFAFVAVVTLTFVLGISTVRSNISTKGGEVLVSSITKLGSIE